MLLLSLVLLVLLCFIWCFLKVFDTALVLFCYRFLGLFGYLICLGCFVGTIFGIFGVFYASFGTNLNYFGTGYVMVLFWYYFNNVLALVVFFLANCLFWYLFGTVLVLFWYCFNNVLVLLVFFLANCLFW